MLYKNMKKLQRIKETMETVDLHHINAEDINSRPGSSVNSGTNSSRSEWKVCGSRVPRSELVFFSQVIILYIVVCLFNLTTGRGDSNLWSALLSGSLGYLLPNPTIKQASRNE